MKMSKPSEKEQLIYSLAYCVEVLCLTSLIDSMGALKAALKHRKVWDQLDKTTIDILEANDFKKP